MLFTLNFSTRKATDDEKHICWFCRKDIANFKERCPACVTEVTADNEKGLLYIKVDDAKRAWLGHSEYDLAKLFRELIAEQETYGYISWFKVTETVDLAKKVKEVFDALPENNN